MLSTMTNRTARPTFPPARRRVRGKIALVALLVAGACSEGSTNPGGASIAGTYALRTLGGATLPIVVSQSGADKVEIVDDTFIVTDDARWTETGHRRTTANGQVSTQTTGGTGTYTRNGALITFLGNNLTTLFGSVSNDTLTISQNGIVAVYQR
jgi:hypothetical protein